MNLKDLQKTITYQWRVQSFSKTSATAACVAYIDARDVMNLLDEVVGPENWQDKYCEAKGNLFSMIGIKVGSEWVWKSDAGSESDIEKEKGEASDSFKRAAVKWGIGRFLYNLEVKRVKTSGAKSDANKYPYVVDDAGQRVWDITAHLNGQQPTTTPAPTPKPIVQAAPKPVPQPSNNTGIPNCPQCGGPMWDNRSNKKNPKAPDFKCQEKVKPCKDVNGKWPFGMWEKKEEQTIQQDEEISIYDIPFN